MGQKHLIYQEEATSEAEQSSMYTLIAQSASSPLQYVIASQSHFWHVRGWKVTFNQ